jgi:hypothetical protein
MLIIDREFADIAATNPAITECWLGWRWPAGMPSGYGTHRACAILATTNEQLARIWKIKCRNRGSRPSLFRSPHGWRLSPAPSYTPYLGLTE